MNDARTPESAPDGLPALYHPLWRRLYFLGLSFADDNTNETLAALRALAEAKRENAALREELRAERDWIKDDGPLHEVKRLRQIERDWGRMGRDLITVRAESDELRRLLGEKPKYEGLATMEVDGDRTVAALRATKKGDTP